MSARAGGAGFGGGGRIGISGDGGRQAPASPKKNRTGSGYAREYPVEGETALPAVSVVIPLYNKGPYITRAINSVLAQTVREFEVIVVDDGSTDDGAEVVGGFGDPRIRLIRQENRGVSAARNRGIEAARGELVAFLDADDEWMPRHLEALLRLREKYPQAGAYGTAYLITGNGSTIQTPSYSAAIPPEPWEGLLPNYFSDAILGSPPISSSIVAVPRCILNEVGGFNTGAWYGEDVDLWGRIALKYPIAFTWDGMGIYHTEASNRACNRREPILEHAFVASARNALQAGEVPPELTESVLEFVASRQIQIACRNLEAGRPDLARNNLKGCKTRRLWRSKWRALILAHIPSGVYLALRGR
ncbi:glycosyltransferase family 2 protein [Methanoculleus sp. FWC-SCC3]|uniref:Glycosyltransferase family 2 protein n=1 Tax=Methanoculleus methanifontis TaxID=2584086 RepID=A0ABT8LZW6_9EURY|nr:glycosyltransferase family A protein [Methanoculleus sp. FWC-SCC3]MDN7012324.1 glycosyltransferase family 2 protein [Methanoculleus sp. FWC-SCC3]